ncbi:MAG: sigma-70 family RNA polymerase sigma factor [Phycisphaerales bacterium]|nr:sigma-70 family RNA polymerase sigma factor [Phycisphaerales bacterium]
MTSDEQLLADYTHGNQQAFATLVMRYQPELFAFLYRFVSDSAIAEDLFQETFVQVHKSAENFDPKRPFRPWLFTIAANKARDYLRSAGRHHMYSLDRATYGSEEETTFLDLMESTYAPPQVELQTAEEIARVQQVLASLSSIYREVLVMSYFHQFSYKEIAEMLQIPLGTVKSRLHAALATFAKAYKQAIR